jgi:hypothetical protein
MEVGAGCAEGGDELAGDQAGLVGEFVDDFVPAVDRGLVTEPVTGR